MAARAVGFGGVLGAPLGALAALSMVLGLCGCGEPGSPAVAAHAPQAIVGDANADLGDPAVVAISILDAEGREGLCTGAVIAPRAVLTAAHCVAPQVVGQGASFSVFLGDDLSDPTRANVPANHVGVEWVAYDPEFDLQLIGQGHDVAVAVTNVPLPVAPLTFEPTPSLEGVDTVRIVGFGITSTDDTEGTSAGRRREATIPLADFDELFLIFGDGPEAPCLGDSGGPVFVADGAGGEQIAGLTSFATDGCGPGAKATNLSAYLPFVREQVAESERPRTAKIEVAGGGCGVAASRSRPFSAAWILGLMAVLGAAHAARARERCSRWALGASATARAKPGRVRLRRSRST